MPEQFTDITIKNLPIENKEYTRREKGGFGVRVHPSGRKNFFYLYRVDGQRRFLNLGEYYESAKGKVKGDSVTLAEARAEYEKQRIKVKDLKNGRSDGEDPVKKRVDAKLARQTAEEEERNATTVSGLVKEYIEKHAMKFKRSWQEDQRLLNKEIVPLWGKRKAEAIKKRDLTLLLEKIIERGSPAMSNQVLKIVRKMFNFAVERDILPHTPFAKFKALAPNNQRNRALSETEIKTFWGTIENAAVSDEIRRV